MTNERRLTFSRGAAAVAAIALLLGGAGATYLLIGRPPTADTPSAPADDVGAAARPTGSSVPGASSDSTTSSADVVVPLSPEAAKRAGIVVASVSRGASPTQLRLPGVVQPNTYKQVLVTPLVSGRLTRVSAALGDRVRRGQTLAEIYSPEIAEARTRYVSARATLEAHDRELQRTEKLVSIGAASRQELERIHAEHASQTAAVQSAHAQLELLGISLSTLDTGAAAPAATVAVRAPLAGVVTERTASVGLNVTPASTLFTVVDLSTVWIVADVFERDLAGVRVGSEAAITTAAHPELTLAGHVSYIDPQVNVETRTARFRVEVQNPRGDLRLGMYADVVVSGTAGAMQLVIPRAAVQQVGVRTVVYVADPGHPAAFVEREVRLGPAVGTQVEVAAGLQPGDRVVVEGSFFVKAERDRLGLAARVGGAATGASDQSAPAAAAGTQREIETAKIIVTERGFEPAQVTVRAGRPARITFQRTTNETCATEIAFPSLGVKKALPLNEAVDIEFTPSRSGEVAFVCGMNMLKGAVIVTGG